MVAIYDPTEFADLVEQESRLENELRTVSERMLNTQATDQWDEQKLFSYQADNVTHARLTRELKDVKERKDVHVQAKEDAEKRERNAQDDAFGRFLRKGSNGLSAEEQKAHASQDALDKWQLEAVAPPGNGTLGEYFVIEMATRSDDSSGEDISQETRPGIIIDRLLDYGAVDRMAQRFNTRDGGNYRIPQMDATAQKGEILDAQNTQVNALDLPDPGLIELMGKTASTRPIIVTNEMIQDQIFDIGMYVRRQATRRSGRIWNEAFTTTQTGTNMPEGVVTKAGAGTTGAGQTMITYPELLDIEYTPNRAYREGGEMGAGGFSPEGGGRIGWMMADKMEKTLRAMIDGDSRPLWTPSIQVGAPNRILGYAYEVNSDMDDPAAGKIPLLFGNFSYYGVRNIGALVIYRFWDSRTAQRNTVEFLGFSRRDARYIGAMYATGTTCEAVVKFTQAA